MLSTVKYFSDSPKMDCHFFVTLKGSYCFWRIYFCFSGNSDKVCHCVTCGQPQLGEAYRCQKNSDSWTLWKSRCLWPRIHPQSKWFLKIAKLNRQCKSETNSKNWISLIVFIHKISVFLEIIGWSDHSDGTKCIFKREVWIWDIIVWIWSNWFLKIAKLI